MSILMTNSVSLNKDSIIFIIFNDDQTEKTLKLVEIETKVLIQNLKKDNKQVKILADVQKLAGLNLAARKYGVKMNQTIEYEKLAIVGASFITKKLITPIVIATGRRFKIKFIETKSEALEWLLM